MEEKVSIYTRNQRRWTKKSDYQKANYTVYSSTHLICQLNIEERQELTPYSLDRSIWYQKTFQPNELNALKSKYYTAHLLAMGIVDEKTKKEWNCPKEIANVSRYSMRLPEPSTIHDIMILDEKKYPCKLEDISVWFFPCDLVILSIEIVDSGTDLNSLTKMHGQWKNWYINYKKFRTGNLDEILKPLAELTKNDVGNNKTSSSKNVINEHEILIDRISNITYKHTKMRQFQVIQIEEQNLRNDLLYELGTHSNIGVVNNPNLSISFKPSYDYFMSIVQENMVSAYSLWKALALNDSFTILAIDNDFVKYERDYSYFEMLYLRCLVQEYFCYNRNNKYRENIERKASKANKKLAKVEKEIELMEKYYFYDDMGYDFLPPLMYKAMVKGLGLEGDKKELTDHVKQELREKRLNNEQQSRRRIERVMQGVTILTLFTATWALYQILINTIPCFNNEQTITTKQSNTIIISFIVSITIVLAIPFFNRFVRPLSNHIVCFLKSGKQKKKKTIISAHNPDVQISLNEETRKHLRRHFDGELPGSKFCFQNAEELLQTIVDSFPKEIAEAQPNAERVKVVSLHFPYEIGTCNVVAIDELTDAERDTLKTVPRGETLARCATSDRVFPTKECQLIMTERNEVITLYPGELAPPLPPTPETSDPYWDKHVFIVPA